MSANGRRPVFETGGAGSSPATPTNAKRTTTIGESHAAWTGEAPARSHKPFHVGSNPTAATRKKIVVRVAQMVRAPDCESGDVGSIPIPHPRTTIRSHLDRILCGSQAVRRPTVNRKSVGSNPTRTATVQHGSVAQMVERRSETPEAESRTLPDPPDYLLARSSLMARSSAG